MSESQNWYENLSLEDRLHIDMKIEMMICCNHYKI